MLINVINLPEAEPKLRLHRTEKELRDEGALFTIWNGLKSSDKAYLNIMHSHKQIVRHALNHNMKMVCIAEDDVRFCAPGAWKYFLANMPKDFDLYLSGIYQGPIAEDNTTYNFSGLHLYVVHSRFFRTFLAAEEDKDMDRALAKQGKFVVCNPFAAVQYNGFSYHTNSNMNYDSYLAGRKLFGK